MEADQTAVIHLLLFLLFLLFSLFLLLFLLLSLLSLSLPFERDEVEADQTAVASSLWCRGAAVTRYPRNQIDEVEVGQTAVASSL